MTQFGSPVFESCMKFISVTILYFSVIYEFDSYKPLPLYLTQNCKATPTFKFSMQVWNIQKN